MDKQLEFDFRAFEHRLDSGVKVYAGTPVGDVLKEAQKRIAELEEADELTKAAYDGIPKTLDFGMKIQMDRTKCTFCKETFTFGPIYKGMHLECFSKFEGREDFRELLDTLEDTMDIKIQMLIDAMRMGAMEYRTNQEAKLQELENILNVLP